MYMCNYLKGKSSFSIGQMKRDLEVVHIVKRQLSLEKMRSSAANLVIASKYRKMASLKEIIVDLDVVNSDL